MRRTHAIAGLGRQGLAWSSARSASYAGGRSKLVAESARMDALADLANTVATRLKERRETIAVSEVLDRRPDLGRPARGPRRISLFSRRRRRVHAPGAHGTAGHHRRGHDRHALVQRALCHARGADCPEEAPVDLGAGRDGRHWPYRQPLRRPGRPFLHRHRRSRPRVITLRTGSDDRVANMHAFAKRALEELAAALEL